MRLNRLNVPIEFRCCVNPESLEPNGIVAFYGIEDNIEYGRAYAHVDEMIKEFEAILACAKDFKEKYAIPR